MDEKFVIRITEEKSVVLNFKNFDEVVDIDRILQINYSKLETEMVVFPLILNRLGHLLAKAENDLRIETINMEVWENQQKEDSREDLIAEKRTSKYTNDDINILYKTKVYSGNAYKARRLKLSKKQEKRDIMNSIYWSAKDKSDKLNAIFAKIHPEQVQLDKIEKIFHGITIQIKNNI